jgi:predicted DNA-binding protein
MKTNNKTSVWISRTIHARLKKLAHQTGRKLQSLVEEAVSKLLQANEN